MRGQVAFSFVLAAGLAVPGAARADRGAFTFEVAPAPTLVSHSRSPWQGTGNALVGPRGLDGEW